MNRNVVYLGLVSFFTDFATAMIGPILPIFVVVYLHEGMDKLGFIVAIATFFSYALRLVSGYISDRYGIVKPLVVAGYALSALSKPLIGFSHGYKSVAFLRALERTGKALRSAPKDALLASFSQEKMMGRTFGFHKTLDIAGELLGTLFLFGLLWQFGKSEEVIRTIFFATAIPGLIGLLIVIFFVKDAPKRKKVQRFRLNVQDKTVIKELFFYFFFLFFFFSDAFFTMEAKTVGISITLIPLLFVLSTLSQTLTSYISGIFIDRFGVRKVLFMAYTFGFVAQSLLFAKSVFYTWLSYIFLGLFSVFSLNANRAYIAQHAKNRASVYGVFYAGIALFGSLGAIVTGFLWQHLAMDAALIFSTGGIFILWLIFLTGIGQSGA